MKSAVRCGTIVIVGRSSRLCLTARDLETGTGRYIDIIQIYDLPAERSKCPRLYEIYIRINVRLYRAAFTLLARHHIGAACSRRDPLPEDAL